MYQAKERGHYTQRYWRKDSACFWRRRDDYGVFSNFSHLPFGVLLETGNGVIMATTSEHVYQALKFPEHSDLQRLILDQTTPKLAAAKGRSSDVSDKMRPDWMEVRSQIMEWVVRYKWLSYQSYIGNNLKDTGRRHIVEASPIDNYWGATTTHVNSESLLGRNVLGRIWESIRDEAESSKRLGRAQYTLHTPVENMILRGDPIIKRLKFKMTQVDGQSHDIAIEAELREVRALIEKGWAKGHFALDRIGLSVLPIDPTAVEFCLTGAVRRVLSQSRGSENPYAVRSLIKHLLDHASQVTTMGKIENSISFNDATDQQQVLNLIDLALSELTGDRYVSPYADTIDISPGPN